MIPVRVAALGVGGWGRTLADAAGRGTGLTIVACTSRSADHRAAFAKTYDCRDLPSFEAILADAEVEGVLITTPHSVHAEQVVAAARAATAVPAIGFSGILKRPDSALSARVGRFASVPFSSDANPNSTVPKPS